MSINTLNPMQRFWLLISPDKKEIRNVYVYAIFHGFVYLSMPIGIQAIINLIQGGQISTSWVVLVIFVIFGIVISGILQINQLRITENLQQKIFTRAAFEFAFRIPRIKIEALYNQFAPELTNRFFDVVSIQKGLSKVLIDFSTASIQTVFGLLLLSLYHPFFIIFSLILIILVYVIFKLTSKNGLQTSLAESKSKYFIAHWLEEVARTSVSFKLSGQTELPMNKTNEAVASYITARESHFRILMNQYKLMIGFKVIVAAGLLIAGSLLVIDQQMNIGQFVAAEIIILLVLSSVEKLILSLETVYDLLTSLEKVAQVTDLPLERNTGMDITNVVNTGLSVGIDNISFNYPGSSKPVFNEATAVINSCEKVMITGDSESGKTTLLYLLAGLYKVNSGVISYNDLPIGNLNPNRLRSIIGDCFIDEFLFEGTLLENISMGRENVTFENVQWAIKNLGLSDFVKSLPHGYNTIVKSNGKHFSESTVAKIILARSVADRPKLLLINDRFVGFDDEKRNQIFDFLTNKENNWTLVLASADEKLMSKMDKVFIVENGSINENTK